jgi:hypothetical protein
MTFKPLSTRRAFPLLAALASWALAGPVRAADQQPAPAQPAPAGAKAAPAASRPKTSPYARFGRARARTAKPGSASAPRGTSQAGHPRHIPTKARAGARR